MLKSFLCGCVVSVFCLGAMARAESEKPARDESTKVHPFGSVMILQDSPKEMDKLAEEIAASFGSSGFSRAEYNPVCCVWMQITRWQPNPGVAGYIIINQGGGSTITASSLDEMKKAVARFKASIVMEDGHAVVPAGLMTDYPIVP